MIAIWERCDLNVFGNRQSETLVITELQIRDLYLPIIWSSVLFFPVIVQDRPRVLVRPQLVFSMEAFQRRGVLFLFPLLPPIDGFLDLFGGVWANIPPWGSSYALCRRAIPLPRRASFASFDRISSANAFFIESDITLSSVLDTFFSISFSCWTASSIASSRTSSGMQVRRVVHSVVHRSFVHGLSGIPLRRVNHLQ